MTTTTPTSSRDLANSLDLVEVKPGLRFSLGTLIELLPNAETVLFFGKVYELDYTQLSRLMKAVLKSDLAEELFAGDHSLDLQDYIVDDLCGDDLYPGGVSREGEITFAPAVPTGEILPELWRSLEVEVAQSIKDVAAKLEKVVAMLPGKQGSMVFGTMLKMNARRPVIGDYRASIQHERVKENLLILDVSGSMTEGTIAKIIEDVIALSYTANAHMAVVSNTTTHWDPGSYDAASVLKACEYGGTHYETLEPLLGRDWGTVITVADYDSSQSAKQHLAIACTGSIDEVLDISLVDRPTFLAECVGQFASHTRPLLIAPSSYVLSN